jgi:hypothetical protein
MRQHLFPLLSWWFRERMIGPLFFFSRCIGVAIAHNFLLEGIDVRNGSITEEEENKEKV